MSRELLQELLASLDDLASGLLDTRLVCLGTRCLTAVRAPLRSSPESHVFLLATTSMIVGRRWAATQRVVERFCTTLRTILPAMNILTRRVRARLGEFVRVDDYTCAGSPAEIAGAMLPSLTRRLPVDTRAMM